MGVSSEILALIAKKLGKTVGKVTDEEIEVYLEGQKAGSKTSESKTENVKTPVDTAKTSAGFSTSGPLVDIVEARDEILRAFSAEGIGASVDELITASQGLSNSMGIGRARAGEFRAMIADTVPEMQKLGFDQQKTLQIMADIPKTLGVNTTLTKETIVEIGSASKISGKEAGDLANKFKGVGFDLSDVGDKMAEVANYAKSIGVNVTAVAGKVVENIGKLNTLNFEGGIKGLAKMVAQSEMLGINMADVLRKGEELLNPESAIEFSSALQRLGVQSSALLDPLSAMDMALNDPAALQNEMVKISQQFTRLKADGSGFEILPGAKLQLREVAKSLGMSADELANMSIKSADLEMKMSKIRFPGFAASEEDKMLIANMAQMKDGRAMVTIAKEGGGTEEVAVEDLTAQQLEELKKEQANQNKTAEDIARDQLSVLEEIAASMKGTAKGISMGIASTGAVQRVTNLSNELRRTVTSVVAEKATTENVRGTVSPVLGGVEAGIVKGISEGDPTALISALIGIKDSLLDISNQFSVGTIDATKKLIQGSSSAIFDQYGTMAGVKPGESKIEQTLMNWLDKAQEVVTGESKNKEADKTNNVNITQNIEFKGNVSQITKENVFQYNDEWLNSITNDPSKMTKVKEGMNKVNSGM